MNLLWSEKTTLGMHRLESMVVRFDWHKFTQAFRCVRNHDTFIHLKTKFSAFAETDVLTDSLFLNQFADLESFTISKQQKSGNVDWH